MWHWEDFPCQIFTVMIWALRHGIVFGLWFCRQKASVAVEAKITICFSMPFSGSCGLVFLGGICHLLTVIGKRSRGLGSFAGFGCWWTRPRMVDDWRFPYQSPSPCSRRKRGNQSLARTKGGLNTKLHLAVDAHGLPVKMIITGGTTADCSQARDLIEGVSAECLMADKAYDTNALLEWCDENDCQPVIPPKSNRKEQRSYDKDLYKLRHLVENAFLKLKQFRGIATRYAKTTLSFLAECKIAAIMLWIT